MSFNSVEELPEKMSPVDTCVQIIDGKTKIVIDGKPYFSTTEERIVIPAYRSNIIQARERFKLIFSAIESDIEN